MGTVNGMMVKSGQIPASVNQGIRESSATANATLGSRLALGDGRVFYYCKNGAVALTVGKLIGPNLVKTERTDTIPAAAAAGTSKVMITAVATITANDYAEGYLVCADKAGAGPTYKIVANDAIASGNGYVYLEEDLAVALTTAVDVYITKSPFSSMILNPDAGRFVMGIPMCAVAANEYFWCQTYGPVAVLCGDSLGAGGTERDCFAAAATGEFVSTALGCNGAQLVGHQLLDTSDGIDTEYHIIMLKCLA